MYNFSLFSVIGIEIEYMLVDRTTLNVEPKSDLILKNLGNGELNNEVDLGEIAVSNELVMHVLELKNNGPKPFNSQILSSFQDTINYLQPYLNEHNLQLLPSSAHPWMNPNRETFRWPHSNKEIYQQYDKIFNCAGHGWSNLQSMHINLPFANDLEFGPLHNAIRLLLPLIPAIAASSPFIEGKATGFKDSRLYYYGKNQQRIPSISGAIIPEFIQTIEQYQQEILQPMYRDINPYDSNGILQHEWLNSRAAIPKFQMGAIEIRIIDTQECVQADYAIAQLIVAVLQFWINQPHYFIDYPADTKVLLAIYQQTIEHGMSTLIDNHDIALQWGLKKRAKTAQDIWCQLIEKVSSQLDHSTQMVLETILSQGNLSERILTACGSNNDKRTLEKIYRQIGHCLLINQLFNPL